MPPVPMSSPELVEIKPNSATEEISCTELADAPDPPPTSQPSPEPIGDDSKVAISTKSEEDASDKTPTELVAGKASSENVISTSQTKEGFETPSDNGKSYTSNFTEKDAIKTTKLGSGKDTKTVNGIDWSDEDSEDENYREHENNIEEQIDEEEDLANTAEGQKIFRERADTRIQHFQQYFKSLEYRMVYFETELKKLSRVDLGSEPKDDDLESELKDEDLESEPKDGTEKISAIMPKAIPSIRRMTWAEFKPSLSPQEASELDGRQRFTWERRKRGPNLQKEKESSFAKISDNQHDGTLGVETIQQKHHVLEVLVEDPGISKRRRIKKRTDSETTTNIAARTAKTNHKNEGTTAQASTVTLKCPERLRICSRPLLEKLYNIVDPEISMVGVGHVMFLRPFKSFVLYENEIRDALKNLEKNWQSTEQTRPNEKTSGRNLEEQQDEVKKSDDAEKTIEEATALDPAADTVVKTDTLEVLQHLRLLTEFFDNDMKSTFALRKQIKAKEACPIAFADLWHLYEHGQEVRTPDAK